MPFVIGLFWLLCIFSWLPTTAAAQPRSHAFPNPLFGDFSKFILATFGPDITLTTVLVLLFSLIDNPNLLNLHACQSHPQYTSEYSITATGWMKTLARALEVRLDNQIDEVLTTQELNHQPTINLATKLHSLTLYLNLSPYDKSGNFKCQIHQVSCSSICSIRIICPSTMVCTPGLCKPYHLSVFTCDCDIPSVTLIEGNTVINNVLVVTGKCRKCKTHYHADHEDYKPTGQTVTQEVFLNSARYLKLGSNLWAERVFSHAVYGAMYHFHASASAFMHYWNDCFGKHSKLSTLGQKHIWQAFF